MNDALSLWLPNTAQDLPSGWFDWTTAATGSTDETQFQVHNNSTQYTASAVTVAITATGANATPRQDTQHYLSTDGSRYTATVTVGDLPPGASSPRITLRRVTPPDAGTGTYSFRITATPSLWQ